MSREQRERGLYHSKYKDRNPYALKTGDVSPKRDRTDISQNMEIIHEYELFADYDGAFMSAFPMQSDALVIEDGDE